MSRRDFDPSTTDIGPHVLVGLSLLATFALAAHPSLISAGALAFCVFLLIAGMVADRSRAPGAPGWRPTLPGRRSAGDGGKSDVQGVFLGQLEDAARVGDTAGPGVDGRIPDGPRVEVRCHEFRIDLSVELPEGASTSIDLGLEAIPAALSGPRAGFARGSRGALSFLFHTWRARRVWTEDGRLRLSIPVDPMSLVTPAWVEKLLELVRVRVLLLTLDEVPGLLADAYPAAAFAPDGDPVARTALTLVGRALASRLESPRIERQGVDEVVSGRLGEQGVTVRVSPGSIALLSFTIPWRAGFDFDRAGLPAEVLARVEQGGDSTGLSDPEAALVDLFGALGCVRLHAHARRAHATLRRDSRLLPEAWARLALAIPARLEGLARSPVVRIGRRASDPEAGPTTCPYCRDAADGEGVAPCESCGTLHHTECFSEAGGCTVLGCAAAPRRSNPPVRT